jgi:hypothetical protein
MLTLANQWPSQSAVPGASKAIQFIIGNPYWVVNSGPVVCEMDAIENAKNGLPPPPPPETGFPVPVAA